MKVLSINQYKISYLFYFFKNLFIDKNTNTGQQSKPK